MQFAETMQTTQEADSAWGDAGMEVGKTDTKRKAARMSQHHQQRGTASGSSVDEITRELDTLKMISNIAQKTRLHASILMWTIMLPAILLEPAINAAKDFGQTNKGVKQHGKGSPHPMVWRITLDTIVAAAKAKLETLEAQPREHLNQAICLVEAHLKALVASGPKKAYFHVRQAQVRTTRDETKSILKFEISQLLADPRATQLALLYVMEALQGSVLEGTEAPTDLERKIQTHIDTLKKK